MKKGREIMLTDSMEGFQEKTINYNDYEVSFRRWLVIQIDSGNAKEKTDVKALEKRIRELEEQLERAQMKNVDIPDQTDPLPKQKK